MAQKTRKVSPVKEKATANRPEPKKKSAFSKFMADFELAIDKYAKVIVSAIVVIAIIIGGYFGYKYLIQAPKEEKAATAISFAQQWFEADSFNLVLNGDGLNGGALSVIKRFGGTKSGNLARFYAGVSYLNTGDYPNAIKYLSKFDGKGTPVQFMAYGALGDAYMESNQVDKGIEFYQKAAADKDNEFIAPLYLFRAGLASEQAGKKDQAIKFYKEVKQNYPRSQQAQSIDKYLARLGEVSMD